MDKLNFSESFDSVIEESLEKLETGDKAPEDTVSLTDSATENHDSSTGSDFSDQATEEADEKNTETNDESASEPSLEENQEKEEEGSDDQEGSEEGEVELPKSVIGIDRDRLNDEAKAVYDTFIKDFKSLNSDYTRKTQGVSSTLRIMENYSDQINSLVESYNSDPEVIEQIGRQVTGDDIMAEGINTLMRLKADPVFQRNLRDQLNSVLGDQEEGVKEEDPRYSSLEEKVNSLLQEKELAEKERVFQEEFNSVKAATSDKGYDNDDYNAILSIWEAGGDDNLSMMAAAQQYEKMVEAEAKRLDELATAKAKELLKSKTSSAPLGATTKGDLPSGSSSSGGLDKSDLSLDNVDKYLAEIANQFSN